MLYRYTFISIISITFFLFNCNKRENKTDLVEHPGKKLSEIYCIACHKYTSPNMLDRSSWGKVLTLMKREMDKVAFRIEDEAWLDIQRYYIQNSPLILPQPESKKTITSTGIFKPTDLLDSISNAIPVSTLVKYDESRKKLYTGDITGNLFVFDRLSLSDHVKIENIPIDIDFNSRNNTLELLGIGSLMPSEDMTGQLIKIKGDGSQSILIDSLKRPVDFVRYDFNNDSSEDYLISSFGSTVGEVNSGKLSLFISKGGEFDEKIIKSLPGATKSVVGDFNRDGKPDIISLFAQGREVIYLFLNKGNLSFEEKVLIEVDPIYGSNDFKLVDLNNDSHLDIIFTNGDNGDNTPVFKFYHGVRIFINNGNFEFHEEYFYPINGASQILVRDFDLDEDLDFVILAMYPDLFSWKNEMLLYFENKGNLKFDVHFIEEEPSGKWILMDAIDYDNDGDDDLVVGTNLLIQGVLIPPKIKQKWNDNPISYKIFSNQVISEKY